MYSNAVVLSNPTSCAEVLSRIRMSIEQFVDGTKTRVIVLFKRQLLTPEMSETVTRLVTYMDFRVTESTMYYTSLELIIPGPLVI